MASWRDNSNPYCCAAWNGGCVLVVRAGYLCKLRILDAWGRPLRPEQHHIVKRIQPAEGPDSRPLKAASYYERRARALQE